MKRKDVYISQENVEKLEIGAKRMLDEFRKVDKSYDQMLADFWSWEIIDIIKDVIAEELTKTN